MKNKQHTPEKPIGQRRNQKENQKVSRDKRKWKHNIPKHMGCSKGSFKREVHSDKHLH